jgi:hypothetical protein
MHTINFAIEQNKPLLLIKPDEVKKSLEQYQGINHLINNSTYKKKIVLDEYFKWDKVEDSQIGLPQLKLFN